MKRWLALAMLGAMILAFIGCGGQLPATTLPTRPGTIGMTQATTVTTRPATIPTTVLPMLPTTVPVVTTQPTTVPTVPTTVPTQPTTLPTVPTTVPTQPTTTAPAPTPTPDVQDQDLTDQRLWVVNGYYSVNLRKSPANDATILESLPEGTQLKLKYWTGKWACVEFGSITGFIMACYIKPMTTNYMDLALDTVPVTATYSYERMMEDLVTLHQKYPDQVELEIIGYSELGRQIPVLRIGNPNAKYHVLIQGAIHGREHMTAWLVMALADYWLDRDLASYGDVCYHLIPMVNPDGVTISQEGLSTPLQQEIYQNDHKQGYTHLGQDEYAKMWKANGVGVDLNRNFPAGWDRVTDRIDPSGRNYKGTEPFSASETRALRDYTLSYDFDATISYHAMGCVIYYDYGDKVTVNKLSKQLAQKVLNVTGYYMIASDGTSHAGYKDWAMDALEIPSLTIEVGCQDAPLSQKELYSTFYRNLKVLPAIAAWLQG